MSVSAPCSLPTRGNDLDYRPTSIRGVTGGLDLTYGYDAVGNLVDIDSGSSPPMEYRYDALGRLTEALDGPAQAVLDKYEYDKTGNRISYTDSFGTKAYAYPANSHRLDSVAGENRAYDAVGNTLSIGASREFEYNDAGRMSRVRNGGVLAMEYGYNGRGEQVRKHLGAASTYTLYDDSGRWLGDYVTSGAVSQQTVWMDDMPVGVLDVGQLYYIQPDHLGTPRTVLDHVRDVAVWAWQSKSEVFGNTPPDQDADGDGVAFAFDMRFPGQRYDAATGMNYNYFRDYDPGKGGYLQSDPIGLRGGVNTYLYSNAQPLTSWDFFGLTPYLSDGPVTASGVMGWVSCSKGSLRPEVNENTIRRFYPKCSAIIGECTLVHENSHIEYAKKNAPGICKERFWEPAYWRVRHLSDTDSRATELYAHAAQLRCLAEKLRQVNGCDDDCRESILRAIRDKSQSVINILYGQYGIRQ
jgi:RHS repeat-associated protein